MIDLKSFKSKHQYSDQQADARSTVHGDVKALHCFIHEKRAVEKSLVGDV